MAHRRFTTGSRYSGIDTDVWEDGTTVLTIDGVDSADGWFKSPQDAIEELERLEGLKRRHPAHVRKTIEFLENL